MKFSLKKNNLPSKNFSPKKLQSYNPASSAGRLQPSRGFTLVELLVTLSLFVALTTIVLFSSSQFNGSILLTNLAYDVALTIRQAQSFGVNVREEVSSDSFDKAYGVHFDTSKPAEFILFADLNKNGQYDTFSFDNCNDGTNECVDKYIIKRGNKISGISCDGSAYSPLDITFIRPNPDAIIKCGSGNKNEAKIKVSSADDVNYRYIVVNLAGQISVER